MKKQKLSEDELRNLAKTFNEIKDKETRLRSIQGVCYHPSMIVNPQQFYRLCAWCNILPKDAAPNTDGDYLAEKFLNFIKSFPEGGEPDHDDYSFMGWLFYKKGNGYRTLEGGTGYNDMIMNGVLNTIRQNPNTAETFRMALSIYESERDDPSLRPDPSIIYEQK